MLLLFFNLCVHFLHDKPKRRHAREEYTGNKPSGLNSSSVQFEQHFSVGFGLSAFTEKSGLS